MEVKEWNQDQEGSRVKSLLFICFLVSLWLTRHLFAIDRIEKNQRDFMNYDIFFHCR